jgi:PilZ domain
MHPINTRRWPRYHVHLPVSITVNPGTATIAVPGLACELSRSGMELYGGINLQPGDLVEVEFQTSGRISVGGIVCNRSGFCFGLEFRAVRIEPEAAPAELESLILQRHEAYLRQMQRKINQSMQAALRIRQWRQEIEVLANAMHSGPMESPKGNVAVGLRGPWK